MVTVVVLVGSGSSGGGTRCFCGGSGFSGGSTRCLCGGSRLS